MMQNQQAQQPLTNGPKVEPPPPLNVKKGAAEWKLFKQMWENYCIVAGIKQEGPGADSAYTKALFLHTLGIDGLEVYNGLELQAEHTVKDVLAAFDKHFIGETNETYERFTFNKRDQKQDETIEDYIAALRTLAKTCNFCDCLFDSLLRDRLVLGIRDNKTRERLLQKAKLNLRTCVEMCRAAEATHQQLKNLGSVSAGTDEACAVSETSGKGKSLKGARKNNHPGINCKFCGRSHPLRKEECPAWGKICKNCSRRNHFAVKCDKKKNLHSVEEDSETDDEVLLAVDCKKKKVIKCEMVIEGEKVICQVDSGASVNVIPAKHVRNAPITTTKKTLHTYNKTSITATGKTVLTVRNPKTKKKYRVQFVVVKEDLIPLLGKNTSEAMQLITVNYSNFDSVAKVTTTSDGPLTSPSNHDFLEIYADVFDGGQGNLPGTAHLEVDPTVTPVTSPSGRVPLAMKAKVKEELKRLTERDVITPVEEPTDWTSRMLIATKRSGELRVCIDPRPLNKALKRERYPLPVMEDILPELAKAKLFSKLDLSSAYWHVHLDEESSLLTTFQTPFGRYRWKRLPFGTSVSSEIFQKRLNDALEGLDGVIGVSDDIIVYGSGDSEEEAAVDHDNNLSRLLERCRSVGMKLNKEKAEIRKTEITFLGHRVTNEGLKIDPNKVTAVLEMKKPENVEDVRRFCGFVQYLSKFLPKLSETLEPIRQLTRENVEWTWTSKHDTAFRSVQKMATEAPVLAFYNPAEELTIQCDSSQSGLGAVLTQKGKPIAYASRSLTDTETRYAQIEKEMLAIVFSLDKFHQYTFGRHTTVESDHKPLEAILRKTLSAAPRRLQGMMLRIQDYDITVRYKKGKEMYLADTLSRAYITSSENTQGDFELVNMVSFLLIREERLGKLKEETEKDDTLQTLKTVITRGWPEDKLQLPAELAPYFSFRDEMSVQDGLLFKGERVVVPSSLRSEMKMAVHSTHTGIEGCLKRARESLFWPGMSGDIKQYISSCETCQTYQSSQQKETLMSHEVPSRQWEKIGVDLFELDQKDYLVTVDYFSNFFEVDRMDNTKASTVIKKLKAHFARYGIPSTVISDNGPQFSSESFAKFARDWDFDHNTSSPYYPKANGKAESAVKTAKTLLTKNKDDQFLALLNHRNTPNETGTSPSQSFLNRRTRTLVPTSRNLLKPRTADSLDNHVLKLKKQQTTAAKYYNVGAKDLPPLEEGDSVRLKPFTLGAKKWASGTVSKRLDERSYEVESGDGVYRRNRIHLKKVEPPAMPAMPVPVPMATAAAPEVQRPEVQRFDVEQTPTRPAAQTPFQPRKTAAQPATPASARPSPMKTSPTPPSQIPVRTSRYGREVKPQRLKDFVYSFE